MKTKSRKLTALLMALLLILACFGCSSDSDNVDVEEKESVEDSDGDIKDDDKAPSSNPSTNFDEEKDGLQSQVTLKDVKVGEYITFGAYEQDNDTSNGKEDIEWLVLDVQDGKALVVSKYGLDCKQYNTDNAYVTWENCTLRSWLNDEFINNTFAAEEKAKIPTVTLSAYENPEYDTDQGNATQDKVFLLSIAEANIYFSSDDERVCEPTAYAVANGTIELSGSCYWLLRSSGGAQGESTGVIFNGIIDMRGESVDFYGTAVRPALWINL